MIQSHSRGVTLAELVVAIAIIGTLSFLLPIVVRLFNNMAYLQQKSVMQKEIRAVLWQMSHEVTNAAKVEIPVDGAGNASGCFENIPQGRCFRIYAYDYDLYRDSNRYENPAMYKRYDVTGTLVNFVQIFYEVVSETEGNHDYNNNGKIEPRPYLLKSTLWENPGPGANGFAANTGGSGGEIRPGVNVTVGKERRETFLNNRLVKSDGSPSFPRQFQTRGSVQLIKVTLSLKSSYDRRSDPLRSFSTIMSMTSNPVW